MRIWLIAIVVGMACGAVPAWADDTNATVAFPASASGPWSPGEWTTGPGGGADPVATLRRDARPWSIRQGPWRPRGPMEIRDEWLLAQPRLTLPPVSPDPIPHRGWLVRFYVNRGSDFGWDQTGPAEFPFDRRFLVDGEHQTTELSARYGLLPRLNVGLMIPIKWRGGGFMDTPIDKFHELTEPIGFTDNGRPAFSGDRYRVEGRDGNGNRFSWNDERGTGLGNIELEAHWNIVQPCCRSDWRASVIGRVGLPTGTGPFDVGGVDGGLQIVVAKQLLSRLDAYAGLGGTVFGKPSIQGVTYETWRVHAFAALEYHVLPDLSILVVSDLASRLVTNIANYPPESWYIHGALRWDINSRVEMEVGFTENIMAQQGTIDFGAFLAFNFQF